MTHQNHAAIVIIGLPGAGKSSVARFLARMLGRTLFDSDAETCRVAGDVSCAAYIERAGLAAFRRSEAAVIADHARGIGANREVWALGAGALEATTTRRLLERDDIFVVWIQTPVAAAWQRVCADGGAQTRPLTTTREAFAERAVTLEREYAAIATLTFAPSVDESAAATARNLYVALTPVVRAAIGDESRIIVDAGAFQQLADLIGIAPGDRFTVVCDAQLPTTLDAACGLVEAAGGLVVERELFSAGEWNKQLASVDALLGRWRNAGVDRSCRVIAVGGGTVLDLVGFAAAIHLRGITWHAVPTTLLAQVDAAIGGKTAVDAGTAKNQIGAFHTPAVVIVDPQLLRTLPAAEWANGFAEVLKTALIAGPAHFARACAIAGASADAREWLAIIDDCIDVKQSIVTLDPQERLGVRAQLNLGHTAAHALEAASGTGIPHGAAVAIGTYFALLLSHQWYDLDQRVIEQFLDAAERASLPTQAAHSWNELSAHLAFDKKRVGDTVGWTLVRAPGDVTTGVPLDDDVCKQIWDGQMVSRGHNSLASQLRQVAVLFGVNLGALGAREPAHYGTVSLPELVQQIETWARERGMQALCRQTDSLERFLALARWAGNGGVDAVIINPGAWTHGERSLGDSLANSCVPVVEVHLSDVDQREAWRQESVLTGIAARRIVGKGADGYRDAFDFLASRFEQQSNAPAGDRLHQ